MKYVYVLTSNEGDYYCEQCMISMISLLNHNPGAEIVLLTDDITYRTLTDFRAEVTKLASNVKIEEYEAKYTQKIRSRLLKTSICRYVEGPFVYLDLDTLIADSLEGVDIINAHIAMVLDQHVPLTRHYSQRRIVKYAEKMNYSAGYKNEHFNSGIIYSDGDETSRQFFDLWHELYLETLKKGIDIDQTSLNEANVRMNGMIYELDGIWNVQINCGLKYISEAKIIHYLGYQPLHKQKQYFNTLPFQLCEEKYLEDIKKQGRISDEVKEIICYPKRAFKTVMIVPEDCVAYRLLASNHMRVLKFIYIKCRWCYRIFERLYGIIFYLLFKRI